MNKRLFFSLEGVDINDDDALEAFAAFDSTIEERWRRSAQMADQITHHPSTSVVPHQSLYGPS